MASKIFQRSRVLGVFGAGGGSPLLLDSMLSTAVMAYSTRKLRAAYAGDALQAENSSSTKLNIGFNGSNDLDTSSDANGLANSSIQSGSGSIGVATWYDQSLTNTGNLTESTFSATPLIVASGVNNTAPSGKVWLVGTAAASTNIAIGSISIAQPYSICFVFKFTTLITNQEIIIGSNGTNTLYFGATSTPHWNFGADASVLVGTPDTNLHCGTLIIDGASSALYLDGTQVGSNGNAGSDTMTGFCSWSAASNHSLAELIVFEGVMGSTDIATFRASCGSTGLNYWGTP